MAALRSSSDTGLRMTNRSSLSGTALVSDPPAMPETRVRSLGREESLEKRMARHSMYSCLENPVVSGAWQATVRHD